MTDSQGRALALAAASAVNTANALRPFDRHSIPSVGCFAAGTPTSEFPLAYLGGTLAAGAYHLRNGALRSATGRGVLALDALSAAGLIALAAAAVSTKPVLDRALRDGLGADYQSRVRHPAFPEIGEPFARRPGLLRTLGIRRRYAGAHDLPYGEHASQVLDIWRRADLPPDGRAPVLIQMPGGQWTKGTKQGQAYPLMSHLAERGWLCVAISYRLSPMNRWPAQIEDVKRAVAWVRDNIARYGGDPDFIALTGGSAGGHLASLAALSDPGEWQPGFEDADTRVSAVATMYGAYDLTNRHGVGHTYLVKHLEDKVFQSSLATDHADFDAASPMSRVRADAPPFFVVHGHNDSMIPVEQARRFTDLLAAVSTSPVVYAELPMAQHSFDVLASTRSARNAEAVGDFLGVAYGMS